MLNFYLRLKLYFKFSKVRRSEKTSKQQSRRRLTIAAITEVTNIGEICAKAVDEKLVEAGLVDVGGNNKARFYILSSLQLYLYLHDSLPVAALYEKLGYATIKHERYPVENGVILVYEVMEKELHKISQP